MANITFAKFLGDTIRESIYTAGFCKITSIGNPKAAAVGTFVSFFADYAFAQAVGVPELSDLIALSSWAVTKILVAELAGRCYDKEFSYFKMSAYHFTIVFVTTLAAQTLGVEDFHL